MDNLKQAGKKLNKNRKEAEQNVRRQKENFPQVERIVDDFGPVDSYKKSFLTSNHPHTTRLDIEFTELQKPCELLPIDEFVSIDVRCGHYGPSDDTPYNGIYHPELGDLFTNIGGWVINPTGGVDVPISGVYQVTMHQNIGSVSVNPASYVTASIRRNGYVLVEQTAISGCGLCAFYPSFTLTTTTTLLAGDNLGAWLQSGPNIPFYTPSNLCGLFHNSFFQASLQALI